MPHSKFRPLGQDDARSRGRPAWLVPLVTFCIGLLLGAGLISLAAVRQARGVLAGDQALIRQVSLRRLDRTLDLDVAQRAELDQILQRVQEEAVALRLRVQPEIISFTEDAMGEALAILNPRQRAIADNRFDVLLNWIELTPQELEQTEFRESPGQAR